MEAIEHYRKGKSLIVASGTGSGKTECFSRLMLDTLLRDPDLSTPGVRVLTVYPLNAPVNNQMDRLCAIWPTTCPSGLRSDTGRLPETTKVAMRKVKRSGAPSPR